MSTLIVDDDDARLAADFSVRCPISGSQAYASWALTGAAPNFMLRRKRGGYPLDDADGELVATGSSPTTGFLDTNQLISSTDSFRWWYYRLFVRSSGDWLSAEVLCKSVLVHAVGKHYDVVLNKHHIPDMFIVNDAQPGVLKQTNTAEERYNVGEIGASYNIFDRLVRLFTIELDRVDAHLKALAALPSIDEAPEAIIAQIANALGYNMDRADLTEARVVLTSLAGIYKRVGTSALIEMLGTAELNGVVPRVQEMSAFVMTAADPDLWV